jgi:hypothetical protein
MKNPYKFKCEDRVIGVRQMDGLNIIDRVGSVIECYRSGDVNIYNVRFDTRFSEKLYDKDMLCWNCYEQTLEAYIDDFSVDL